MSSISTGSNNNDSSTLNLQISIFILDGLGINPTLDFGHGVLSHLLNDNCGSNACPPFAGYLNCDRLNMKNSNENDELGT